MIKNVQTYLRQILFVSVSRTLVQCMGVLSKKSDGCVLQSIIQTPENVSINLNCRRQCVCALANSLRQRTAGGFVTVA